MADLGDTVTLHAEVRDATTGALGNATTVVFTVTLPDGTTSSPTGVNVSTGIYEAAYRTTVTGWHTWQAVATGAIAGSGQTVADGFTVYGSQPYASTTDLRTYLGLGTDSRYDGILPGILVAASDHIDDLCSRTTFRLDPTVSARVFNPTRRSWVDDDGGHLSVPDIGSAAGVKVETGTAGGSSWTDVTAQTELEPLGDIALGQPATSIGFPNQYWPLSGFGRRVRVTARWGWPRIPTPVQQATLIAAARLFRRKDSPEGILGTSDFGTLRISRSDPDMTRLLAEYLPPQIG